MSLPPAIVTSVDTQVDGSVNWVFDSSLDGVASPWTNLDGFLVNGETTLAATKVDAFTINMQYTTPITIGDPWVLNAALPTHVIFNPARVLQSSSGSTD